MSWCRSSSIRCNSVPAKTSGAYPRALDDELGGAARRRGRGRVHADRRRHVPGRYPHLGAPGQAGCRARRCFTPNAFRGGTDRCAQAVADSAAGSRILRREGLPATGAGAADGRRPQRRRGDRRRADRAGSPTGWLSRRATATSTRSNGSSALRPVVGAARRNVRRFGAEHRPHWTPPAPCSTKCPPSMSITCRCATRSPGPPTRRHGIGRMLVAARLGRDQTAGQHRDRHRSNRRHRRTITGRVV